MQRIPDSNRCAHPKPVLYNKRHVYRTGTASWTDKSLLEAGWYPPGVRGSAELQLRYYAERFDLVEFDGSYYALPRTDWARRWVERTPAGFLFNVKAFSLLTRHPVEVERLPKDLRALVPQLSGRVRASAIPQEVVEAAWERFLGFLEPLEQQGRLGYLLFQFGDWFRPVPKSLDYLEEVSVRAAGYTLAVEFRHESWYAAGIWPRVRRFLEEAGLVHVVVDAPALEGVPPRVCEATSQRFAVLRCHGRNQSTWSGPHQAAYQRFNWAYSEEELLDLAGAARELAQQAEQVHIVWNNNYGKQGVESARAMQRLLGIVPYAGLQGAEPLS